MIEIMRAIVDLLARATPLLYRTRRDKRLREIGAELFLLYIRLNEALVCADRIVNQLALSISGDHPRARSALDGLRYEVSKQYVTLRRISGLLESQRIRLILLDAGVYRQLVPLISAKMSGLQVLIETLRRGYLPIDVPEQDIRALSSGEGWEDGTPPPEHFSLLVNIQANALPDHGRWDQDRRTRLAAYLQHRDPQGQLAQIRAAVEQLRVALVANFSLEDMLLTAGDCRLDTDT